LKNNQRYLHGVAMKKDN